MKAKLAAMALLMGGMWAAPVEVQAEEGPHSFSGLLGVYSDYRFRGISQTDLGPAIQLSLDYGHESGFYAGLFGSNVDFDDDSGADIELNIYVGFAWDVSEGANLDLGLVSYIYPGTNRGVDFDYNEFIAKMTFAEQYHVELGYSNDVFASGETGVYFGTGGSWALPSDFELIAAVGYYNLDSDVGESYVDWNIGVARTWDPVTVSLAYHDTNSSGEDTFGDFAKGRLVLGFEFGF